jgi:hypothetical protein
VDGTFRVTRLQSYNVTKPWLMEVSRGMAKIRRPKAEVRRKSETRKSNLLGWLMAFCPNHCRLLEPLPGCDFFGLESGDASHWK